MIKRVIKYAVATMVLIAMAIGFIISGGLFYFFGNYGVGGSHYECNNIDFRLSYDNYSAFINGEYLSSKNWRALPGDEINITKHYWVGSNHSYITVINESISSPITYYVDGKKCEKFKNE